MDQQHVIKLLRALHEELEQGGNVDDGTAGHLRTVLTDIEDALEKSSPPADDEPHTFAERLKEATWHLEESHPRLTNTVSQLIDVLGRTIQ